MDRKAVALLFVFLFSLFCLNASAQVEYVFSSAVTDEATLVEAYDAWFSSADAKQGQTATLLASVINGDSATTHTTVLDFPDYASLEKAMNKTTVSEDFDKLERHTSGKSTALGEGLYLRVVDNGKSWKTGDYLFVRGVNVSAQPVFVAAFKDMLNSEIGKKAPGLIRLVSNRAGSDISHTVIISAPSFVDLNKFVDTLSGSKEMEVFISKIAGSATPSSAEIYNVVKVWK